MKLFFVCVAALLALASCLPNRLVEDRDINDAGCGVVKVSSRIVGGKNAYKGQFPWQISLFYDNRYHTCGGTIIDDYWVMSAAHCFRTTNPRYYTVKAGAYNIHKYESHAESHSVKKIYIHESYSSSRNRNDIALLELDKPLNFKSDYINRVCLPKSSNYNVDNKPAIISGWGDTKNVSSGNMPSILQWAETTITDKRTCANAWTSLYDHKTQVCSHSKTTATCSGDSGGPMTVDDGGKTVQVGVSSFGSSGGCVHQKYPKVFSRVSAYLTWIKGKLDARQQSA